MAKKEWRLSASLISSFKACAMRCCLKYVHGLVPIEETDSQRQGTNWHKILEIANLHPDSVCPDCFPGNVDPECPICEGTGSLSGEPMDAVIRYLNKAYETVPMSKTQDEWLTERVKLLYSLSGYNWYHINNPYEVVAEEIKFRIPVRNPESGRALPNVVIDGIIDKIVRNINIGKYYIMEHKSTIRGIDPDSIYWNHLNLDTQTRLYPYAAIQLQLDGKFEQYGIKPDEPVQFGVLYDVWHKPQISPKKLTQADSKKFVENGEYCGEKFEIGGNWIKKDSGIEIREQGVIINDSPAEIEPGKKEGTFAIRETPDMYGARLLQDIGERPEFYFARREVARTVRELKAFEYEIYNIYQTIKFMDKNGRWWTNEQQCEATFRCPYTTICYHNIDVSDGAVPEGFKCIFGDKENGI